MALVHVLSQTLPRFESDLAKGTASLWAFEWPVMVQQVLISISIALKSVSVIEAGYSVTFIEAWSVLIFQPLAITASSVVLSRADHRVQRLVEFSIGGEYVERAFRIKERHYRGRRLLAETNWHGGVLVPEFKLVNGALNIKNAFSMDSMVESSGQPPWMGQKSWLLDFPIYELAT